MGQYYQCYTKEDECKLPKIYNLQTKKWKEQIENQKKGLPSDWTYYNGLKLMEHSWIGNSFMNFVDDKLLKKAIHIWWVGDYSDDIVGKKIYKSCWNDNEHRYANHWHKTDLNGLILVNYSKKCFIDMNDYIELGKTEETDINGEKVIMTAHPVPILTACGNGRGGGDYYGSCMENVGTWAGDLIGYEKKVEFDKPDFTKLNIYFKEKY